MRSSRKCDLRAGKKLIHQRQENLRAGKKLIHQRQEKTDPLRGLRWKKSEPPASSSPPGKHLFIFM